MSTRHEMTPHDRVRAAMSRRVPDRVPKTAEFTATVYERYREHVAAELGLDLKDPEQAARLPGPAEYFGIEVRGVGFRAPRELPDFRPFFSEELPDNTSFSEYGTAHIPGTFYHFSRYRFPLAGAESLNEYEGYPWPDFTPPWRHEHLEADVKQLLDAGWYVLGSVGHIFENAWQIRSMEKLFEDMILRPELATYLLDRLTEDRAFQARRYAEAGCDCLHCGDDVGMQDRLMMSPDLWRHWFKPRWAHVWQVAKRANPDIQIWYHSDGYIEPIIPDLIEIGLEILNPVQPECMNPVKLKRQYGNWLAFWGCVGTQTVMPFGTPETVRHTVKRLIETVGEGGGLLLAPTHVLEPDVPWENVLAFFEAVDEYGVYE
ncbi:MAG: uroporphyrinogen decarboxylase family protein [Armatimonadota bacterium]